MRTTIETRTDHTLQAAVQAELEWIPEVDAAGIGVAVENSIVTLSGEATDYSELLSAVRAATRVRGVSTVVNDLTIPPSAGSPITGAEIAREVVHALTWAITVPETVKAELRGHTVILTGEVEWNFQRVVAKNAVKHLRGVHSVDNRMTLTARASAVDAEERVRNALVRNAQLDANHITVSIVENRATLHGHVQSLAEKDQAGMATWASPHVTDLDNRLEVRPLRN